MAWWARGAGSARRRLGRRVTAIDRLHLAAGVFPITAVVDDIVRPRALVIERHLGRDPQTGFVETEPASLRYALELRLWINPDHDDLLHDVGPPVLVQQGDVQDENARSLAAGRHLYLHPCTDRRGRGGGDPLGGRRARPKAGPQPSPPSTP